MTDQTQNPSAQPLSDPHLIYYAKLGGECVQNISRQLETNDILSTIHRFNGLDRKSYRTWRKDLARAALETTPVDDIFMRKLVTRTVTETASDFWTEIRTQKPDITWVEIQQVFNERFRTFVDAQLAKQKLPKLRQEKRETLHSFAQRIHDTAREAYTDKQLADEVVTENLREIFLNGMIDIRSSNRIIREEPKDLAAALDRAVREEMLNESFKIRRTGIDTEGRLIVPMDINRVDCERNNEDAPVTKKQFDELSNSIAAITSTLKKREGQENKTTRENNGKTNRATNYVQANEQIENPRGKRNKGRYRNENSNFGQPQQPLRYIPGTEFVPRGAYQTVPVNKTPLTYPQNPQPHDYPVSQNPQPHDYPINQVHPKLGHTPRETVPNYQSPRETVPNYQSATYYPTPHPSNNELSYQGAIPRQNLPQRVSQPQVPVRFRWTQDNRPICGHCNKPGHMMKTCYMLHPELRPNNNGWQSQQRKN